MNFKRSFAKKKYKKCLRVSDNSLRQLDGEQIALVDSSVIGVFTKKRVIKKVDEKTLDDKSDYRVIVDSAVDGIVYVDSEMIIYLSGGDCYRKFFGNQENRDLESVIDIPGLRTLIYDSGSKLYVNCVEDELNLRSSRYVNCIDKETLFSEWKYELPGRGLLAITFEKTKMYAFRTSLGIFCLDKDNGRELWSINSEVFSSFLGVKNSDLRLIDSIAIRDDVAALWSESGNFFGVDLNTQEVKWKTPAVGLYKFAEDHLGFVHAIHYKKNRDWLCKLDPVTGEVLHDVKISGEIYQRVVNERPSVTHLEVTETHLWVSWCALGAEKEGIIAAVNLKTGVIDWHEEIPVGVPLFSAFFICNNRLFFETVGGMNNPVRRSYVLNGEGGYIPD